MKKLLVIFLAIQFGCMPLFAQDMDADVRETIASLRKRIEQIEKEEKNALRKQVEDINSLLDNGVIGIGEANRLKLKAAEGRAQKIDERQAVLLETIAYLEKKKETQEVFDDVPIFLDIDAYFKENGSPTELEKTKERPLKVVASEPADLVLNKSELKSPTTLDLVFALGLNNTVKDGITWYDIEDENDYLFYSSRFLEFGFTAKTPLVKKNGLRLKYGLSLQFNELEPSGNRFFTEIAGQTVLEEFPSYLNRSSFVVSNLVLPVHLEFGPTKKRYNSNGSYYSARNKFKIGIGGYVGLNLDARQKLEYRSLHRRRWWYNAEVIDGYDINKQIYGVSAYIGVGAISLYGKYDLNTIFGNGISDEQFVSAGLRIDL